MSPGRVFRRDHGCQHAVPQIEGLAVDTDVTFSRPHGHLAHFAKQFSGRPEVRLPPLLSFTEPSAELHLVLLRGWASASWGSGWIEIGGSGMVHPNVFRAVGYDPQSVTGFAFGVASTAWRDPVPPGAVLHDPGLRVLEQFR
jgi:phenylalanyl-tRNA synthetase alpha chain